MFSTEQEKLQGVSAVKALAVAGQLGQKIWTIDANNLEMALNEINLSAEAENDIRNAVYAGKIATAHEARINVNGWVGEGYTLIDPQTGAGAYMIAGGNNGGELKCPIAKLLGWYSYAPVSTLSAQVIEPVITNETNIIVAAQRGTLDGLAKFYDCHKEAFKVLSIIALAVIAAIVLALIIPAISTGVAVVAAVVARSAAIITRTATAMAIEILASLYPPPALAMASTKDECNCQSGITSWEEGYFQCWICSPESKPAIDNRANLAKESIQTLQTCQVPPAHTVADLFLRIAAFEEGIISRTNVNQCWDPRGEGHVKQVEAYEGGKEKCLRILRRNHGIK